MAGGSHNRKSSESLKHVLQSEGKLKLCKCPLHRNNGKGTMVSQTKFKRHTLSGVQGMCAEGKTLIDSFSHTLKRLQLLSVVDEERVFEILNDFDKKYDELVNNIKIIIKRILTLKNVNNLNKNEFKLYLLTKLDEELKTNATGFYDVKIKPEEKIAFNKILQNKFTSEVLNKMKITQAKWTKGHLVLDSKDQKLYPVEDFVFNVSKKRELYTVKEELTPYRINVHNTRAKGQRSSTLRGEKYLACGEYTEANRAMKRLGNQNKNIHADHIIPLAAGGIHDERNLRALDGKENIKKKDKLTQEGFEILKKDVSFLSKWHRDVFEKHKHQGLEVVWEYLKNSVAELRKNVINLNFEEKFGFIQKVYPQYKESQIKRIIKKHFTEYED
jgi:hypothetical protein